MMLRPHPAYGMGTLYKADSEGHVIDCDSWSNFFQGVCWNPFASEVVPAAPSGGDGSGPAVPAVPAPTTPSLLSGVSAPLLLVAGGALAVLLLKGGK